ncbi:MAG: Na/Pi cotransporter family protein [Planctomycetota bacterium]
MFALITELFGGLALFLFGMDLMTDALKAAAGTGLRKLLLMLTRNRIAAAGTGIGVTAVVQSSSVTSVLVIGFITAGLMNLEQGIGVTMGAKLGTTITGQIIAFKITEAAYLLVALGFFMHFVLRRERLRQIGSMLLGLGLIFVGMMLMKDATGFIKQHQGAIDLLARMEHPLLGLMAGTLFTFLVQSSSATIGIIIVLAGQQATDGTPLLSVQAGIALGLGANVGTGITAVLAAIGKPREAVRLALFHIGFAATTAVAWIPLLGLLQALADWLSPAGDHARQLANAMTAYNAINLVLFIGAVPLFAALLRRVVPPGPAATATGVTPRFLSEELLGTPTLALDGAQREVIRMGAMATAMLEGLERILFADGEADVEHERSAERDIDRLQAAVVGYLRSLSQEAMAEAEARRLAALLAIAGAIENASDLVADELAPVGPDALHRSLRISQETASRLAPLLALVTASFRDAVACLERPGKEAISSVEARKAGLDRGTSALRDHLLQRLGSEDPHRLELYRLESDVLEYLRHIYHLARRIARSSADVDLGVSIVAAGPERPATARLT